MGSVYSTLPPISRTFALPSRCPFQPLLQGWEQPIRTVSHQFCARRLLRPRVAAGGCCTSCSSLLVESLLGELPAVQQPAGRVESSCFLLHLLSFLLAFLPNHSVLLSVSPIRYHCFNLLLSTWSFLICVWRDCVALTVTTVFGFIKNNSPRSH